VILACSTASEASPSGRARAFPSLLPKKENKKPGSRSSPAGEPSPFRLKFEFPPSSGTPRISLRLHSGGSFSPLPKSTHIGFDIDEWRIPSALHTCFSGFGQAGTVVRPVAIQSIVHRYGAICIFGIRIRRSEGVKKFEAFPTKEGIRILAVAGENPRKYNFSPLVSCLLLWQQRSKSPPGLRAEGTITRNHGFARNDFAKIPSTQEDPAEGLPWPRQPTM